MNFQAEFLQNKGSTHNENSDRETKITEIRPKGRVLLNGLGYMILAVIKNRHVSPTVLYTIES